MGDLSEVPAAAIAVAGSTATSLSDVQTFVSPVSHFYHPITDERIDITNVQVADGLVAPRIASTT
jgi:hypothetical protein